MYDPLFVQTMRDELARVGFQELRTAEEVDALMARKPKTSLVFVNSVCGCAAGVARPALIRSLESDLRPLELTTVFAGNDVEALARAREYFVGYPPSSPCAALFRESELVHLIERYQIERQSVEALTKMLISAYHKFCGEEIDEGTEIYDPLAELQVTVEEAKERLSSNSGLVVLDVRQPSEIAAGKIEGSLADNNRLVQEIVRKWSPDREIIVYCEHGERSLQAVQFLRRQGFQNAFSPKGGFAVWSSTT